MIVSKRSRLIYGAAGRVIAAASLLIGVVSIGGAAVFFGPAPAAQAAQTAPHKVNFQGRLTDTSGNPKPDGLYNIKFRLFAASSGGVASWTETRETTDRVQVTNGLFNVQLGDVTALSPSNFTSYPLYLEVELPTPATATCSTAACASWAEGAMTPRSPLGASPYAFSADTVDGIDSDALVRLDASTTLTGTALFKNASNSTSAFAIQASGGANLLVADTTNLALKVGGGDVSTDASPALLVVDHKSTSGDPTGTNGAIYYNASSKKFRCYEDGEWKDCIPDRNARTQFAYRNDFMTNGALSTDDFLAYSQSSNGGSAAAQASIAGRPGLLRLSAGYFFINPSSYAAMMTKASLLEFGQYAWQLDGGMRTVSVSGWLDDKTTRFGFMSTADAESSSGCYLRHDGTYNSGRWQGICRNGGSQSVCDTGASVSAGSWYDMSIAVNAAASSVVFVVNDTDTCTITTNIPTTNRVGVGASVTSTYSEFASYLADLDYIHLRSTTPISR